MLGSSPICPSAHHGPRTPASASAYLFLDVDGVLNPEAWALGGDWQQRRFGGYHVWTSAELGRWLVGLIDGGVAVVWATTWVHTPDLLDQLAVAFGLPPNLPSIDRIEWNDHGAFEESGKRPGVLRWLDEHRVDPSITPVVWADDCLGPMDLLVADALGIHAQRVPSAFGLRDFGQRSLIEQALGLGGRRS